MERWTHRNCLDDSPGSAIAVYVLKELAAEENGAFKKFDTDRIIRALAASFLVECLEEQEPAHGRNRGPVQPPLG